MMGMFRNWLNDCNMKKYGILQLKRVARFLPWALCVVLVLFGCMSVLFYALTNTQTEKAGSKIRIGVDSLLLRIIIIALIKYWLKLLTCCQNRNCSQHYCIKSFHKKLEA